MKFRTLSLIVLSVVGVGWYLISQSDSVAVKRLLHGAVEQQSSAAPAPAKPTDVSAESVKQAAGKKVKPKPAPVPLTAAQEKVEANKAIDREHLKKLHAGVFGFKAKYGHYPEYLSQLVPEFVTADILISPNGSNLTAKQDHPDPGVQAPHYGYEFSNLEFRDGRTFAEIKEIQRSEWGDAVPMLRYFGYQPCNCACPLPA
jgi:hypothetical protein